MTQSDYGKLGATLRFQYRKLREFAEQIKAGLLTDKEILARAALYANSARTSYYDGLDRAKQAAGYTEEMRVLGLAEHCDDCPPLAGFWAPIGSLPRIGATQCITNCKCTKVYRRPGEAK
jgi:hypothetical protein